MDEGPLQDRVLRKLRLRHLELLQVLFDAESLRVASEKMHLSQPAISKMLKEIEAVLGGKLFERSKSGIRPTPAGMVAMGQAIVVCNEIGVTATSVQRAMRGGERELRVGSLTITSILPKAIANFRRCNPESVIKLREGSVDLLIEDLLKNKLDCAFGALSPALASQPLMEQLDVVPVALDWICMAASFEHPMASRDTVELSELLKFPWILPPPHTMLRQIFVSGCLQRGVRPPAASIESVSPVTLSQLIRSDNRLIGVMRKEQLRGESHLAIRDLPVLPRMDLPAFSFVTRRTRSASLPAVLQFLQALRASVSSDAIPSIQKT